MTKTEAGRLVTLVLGNWPSMQTREIRADITAAMWQKLLADIPYELAEQAVTKVLLTAKFWPTISEIREAADSLRPASDGPPPADSAWEEVCRSLDPYKVPNWSHPAIGQAVKGLGGIRRLCESENTAVDRAHFIKIYEAIMSRAKNEIVNHKVLALVSGTTNLLAGGQVS